ncbi:SDR family oxidoreductase [Nocardia takedensis]
MKIFVTGGSGVVGVPLLPMLTARHEVLALTRRRPVAGATAVVRGDLTAPGLGLSAADRAAVLDGLDCVVHVAASVDFAAGEQIMESVNVAGTRRVLELAEAAGARVVHVSTAFVDVEPPEDVTGGHATLRPGEYLAAKRAGEALVRASGLRHTIVRPSAITGDTRTGEITEYQGVHSMSKAMLRGSIPLFLCTKTSRFDLVPRDVVAAMIAAAVDDPDAPDLLWATVGPTAVTADRLLELLDEILVEHALPQRGPRRVDPEVFRRLLEPAFFADLRDGDKTKMANLMSTLATLFQPEAMPTSLGLLPGTPAPFTPADAENVVRTTLRFVLATEGMAAVATPLTERNEVTV